MNTTHKSITCLLRSAVSGDPVKLPEGMDLQEVYALMRRQSVLPLMYQGAKNCGVPGDHPVMQTLLANYFRILIKSEKQQRMLERMFQAFQEHEIPFMPVKGCILKGLYPKPEMRPMGDADILIRQEDHDRILPLMEELGFHLKSENDHVFNWLSDDLYVELHKSLVPPEDRDYYAYYGTGWRMGRFQEGSRYFMSDEDAFLFIFTHFARHYRISGIGCRHVLDLYVYRKQFPDLDEQYIKAELDKLHLTEFYRNMLRVLEVWFEDGAPDEITELITAYVFSGGNWGTMEAGMLSDELRKAREKGSIKHSGIRSVMRAIFPPFSSISCRYPVVYKRPWLLPFAWVFRWFDVLLFKRKNIRERVRILREVDDKTIQSHRGALNAVGLDFSSDDE